MSELTVCHAIVTRAKQPSYTGISYTHLTEIMIDAIHDKFNVISLKRLSEADYIPACQYIKTWHPSPDFIINYERRTLNDRKQ